MADFCFLSSRVIPISSRIVDNTRTFFSPLNFDLVVHKARLSSFCFQGMLFSNSLRFLASLSSSGKPTRLEKSAPTDMMFRANSQFNVEMDVYSLSMDIFSSFMELAGFDSTRYFAKSYTALR